MAMTDLYPEEIIEILLKGIMHLLRHLYLSIASASRAGPASPAPVPSQRRVFLAGGSSQQRISRITRHSAQHGISRERNGHGL